MEKRKNPKLDLEKKRGLFFFLGLTVTLSATLMAIQHTTVETQKLTASLAGFTDDDNIEIAPISFPKKPDAPKLRPQDVIDVIDIIDDDVDPNPDPNPEPQPEPDPFSFDPEGFGGDGDLEVVDPPVDQDPLLRVEIMPHFVDCKNVKDRAQQEACTNKEIISIVAKNADFPRYLVDAGIEGTVYVSFVVSKRGKVEDIKIARGVHPRLDKEAIKAVEALPDFVPGEQQGQKARVIYNIPVNFKINR
ncbi:MAG: energy transducer TonB [Flavobacteriales bacterium]|nr:energy transducer TonB [Flavobacteriales bacterium]